MPEKTIVIKQNLTLDKIVKKLRKDYLLPTDFRLFLKEIVLKELSYSANRHFEHAQVPAIMNRWGKEVETGDDLYLIGLFKRFWGKKIVADHQFEKIVKSFLHS